MNRSKPLKRNLGKYFQTIGNKDVEQWWAILPHNLIITSDWINNNIKALDSHIDVELIPYLHYVATLYNRAIEIASHGMVWEAVMIARAILERIAYIEVIATNQILTQTKTKRVWLFFKKKYIVQYGKTEILAAISSTNKSARINLNRLILQRCEDVFPDLAELYNQEFSQYFTHVSNFDQVISEAESCEALRNTYRQRLRFMPLLLLMEVGEVVCHGLELLYNHYNLSLIGERTQGRDNIAYSILTYTRLSFRLMIDQHNKQLPFEISMLMTGVKGYEGKKIGMIDIYRGGMKIIVHGDITQPISDKALKDLAIYGIGQKEKASSVKKLEQGTDWVKYEIRWNKYIDITQVALALVAGNLRGKTLDKPRYMDGLIVLLQRKLEEAKAFTKLGS